MLEYIYICRHGFRSNWVDPSIKTGPTGMNRDPPLAVYGEEQAEILAGFLSDPKATKPYPTPEVVYSSPFYRCVQTALPTARALGLTTGKGKGKAETVDKEDEMHEMQSRQGLKLDHGVMEWFSPVLPGSGLHPRPGSPSALAAHFPADSIDESYTSTVFPSRLGETFADVHDRAELFVEAFVSRVEEMFPDVKTVVVFSHAATLIALGRALTGDRSAHVVAGCASTSLYKRRSASDEGARGVGAWDVVWNGKADYLPNGVERDWAFADAVVKGDGEVINDRGEGVKDTDGEKRWPEGLAEGGERWLDRGRSPFAKATDSRSGDGLGAKM